MSEHDLEHVPSVAKLLGMIDQMENAPIMQHMLRVAAQEVILKAFEREEERMRAMARDA